MGLQPAHQDRRVQVAARDVQVAAVGLPVSGPAVPVHALHDDRDGAQRSRLCISVQIGARHHLDLHRGGRLGVGGLGVAGEEGEEDEHGCL